MFRELYIYTISYTVHCEVEVTLFYRWQGDISIRGRVEIQTILSDFKFRIHGLRAILHYFQHVIAEDILCR